MKTLDTLQTLVGHESVTGHEASIAAFIAERCSHYGWRTETIDGNVIAHLSGVDSSKAFIVNGHLDTIPATEDWKTDPFALTEDPTNPDRVYGLGVSDMKSGLALMLDIAEENTLTTPPYDLWLFFTRQEETDNAGARAVAEWFASNYLEKYQTVGGLILEPTDAQFIGAGHRNGLKLDLVANGIGGHGSKEYPAHLTAIGKLSRFVTDLASIREDWRATYSHELLGAPTINPTNIVAGNGKHNVIPSIATAEFDLRTTPGLTNALPQVLAELERRYDITITSPWEPAASTVCPPRAPIYQAVQRAAPNLPIKGFPGATDLVAFLEKDIPLLIYGPGATDAMHIPNEYVQVSAIKLARTTIRHIMQEY